MTEHKKSLSVATIVPGPKSHESGAHLARGTRVILSDGSELAGVTELTLTACVNGVWQATITVDPLAAPTIAADAEIVEMTAFNEGVRHSVKVAP